LLRPEKILQWLEASIFDRVYIDLKTQKGNLEDRVVDPFYTFFYDQQLIKAGTYKIALKNIM
jgi:hypothetical protein